MSELSTQSEIENFLDGYLGNSLPRGLEYGDDIGGNLTVKDSDGREYDVEVMVQLTEIKPCINCGLRLWVTAMSAEGVCRKCTKAGVMPLATKDGA